MIKILIEKVETWYSAIFIDLWDTGVIGNTIKEIKERVPLVYNEYIQKLVDDKSIFDYGYYEELSYYKGENTPEFKYFIQELD